MRAYSRQLSTLACAIPVVMALAACGSGGHGAGTAEGVYGGTLSGSTTSTDFQFIVLESGEFWSLYGGRTSTKFNVAGFLQGNGVSDSGNFTSSDTTDFGFHPSLAGRTNAIYNAGAKTISGTITAGAGSVAFSGGPITGATYNYNTPASLQVLVGSWSMTTLTRDILVLSVATDGSFSTTSTNPAACNFTGVVTPRPSGKNVFNVSVTFGPAHCASPGQTAQPGSQSLIL